MPGDKLKFVDFRKPKLEAGKYELVVNQKYSSPKNIDNTKSNSASLTFRVLGDKVRLADDQIFAKYPPAGEQGDFSDTIPHIALNKSTLPWERSAYVYDSTNQEDIEILEPWLYLMLLNENDIARGDAKPMQTIKLGELLNGDAYLPQPFYDTVEENITDTILKADEEVKYVDIKVGFFRELIADNKEHLEYLAHMRQRLDDTSGEVKRELAVITANRFAQANNPQYPLGMLNHGMLVSLEKYLQNVNPDDINDDIQKAAYAESLYIDSENSSGTKLEDLNTDSYVRFIVLTNWSFTSKDVKINFEQRTAALDAGSLRLPSVNAPDHEFVSGIIERGKVRDSGSDLDERLAAGMTPLEQSMRGGHKLLSWYRGPCVPFIPTVTNKLESLTDIDTGQEDADDDLYVATDADKLLYCYQQEGMLDISYSASYELGKFLAIRNINYAKAIHRYKTAKSRYVRLVREDELRAQQGLDKTAITVEQLPYSKLQPSDQYEDFQIIKQYISELILLKDVPSWYLVADPDLLPMRSVRTFNIDSKWIESLLLGALSLGGWPQITYDLYKELYDKVKSDIPQAGMLLRSDIVWAYPQLMIELKQITANDGDYLDVQLLREQYKDAYNDFIEGRHSDSANEIQICNVITEQELADDLLLVFVDKSFNYISMALPPESLHYGADVTAVVNDQTTTYSYTKDIKYSGRTIATITNFPVNDRGIINMEELATEIQTAIVNGLEDATTDVDKTYKDTIAAALVSTKSTADQQETTNTLLSARLGRYMLEGEPKIEFSFKGD